MANPEYPSPDRLAGLMRAFDTVVKSKIDHNYKIGSAVPLQPSVVMALMDTADTSLGHLTRKPVPLKGYVHEALRPLARRAILMGIVLRLIFRRDPKASH